MGAKKSQKEKPDKSSKKAGKSSKGSSLFSKLFLFSFLVFSILVIETGISFIPHEKIPDSLKPVHAEMLFWRNSIIARTGLPFERYKDSYSIEAGGGNKIDLFFAPSPKIQKHLEDFIQSAEASLDICIFDLDLENVIKAIISEEKKKVKVRILTDTDNIFLRELSPLKKAAVTIKGDDRKAFMHNKFIVADGKRVWTGSFNFTKNCAFKNDNNALILNSTQLAANYTLQFNELWNRKENSPAKREKTSTPELQIGKISVENYFAPDDSVTDQIVKEIINARSTIDVMAFSFTSAPIAKALQTKMDAGLKVRIIFDSKQAKNEHSQDKKMRKYGALVKLSRNHSGVMHHKVMIIDNETVITGSFNFSKNANENNDENIVIFRSRELAAVFEEEFYRCWTGIKGY